MMVSVEVLITHHSITETIFAHGRHKTITSLSSVSGRVQESHQAGEQAYQAGKRMVCFSDVLKERDF